MHSNHSFNMYLQQKMIPSLPKQKEIEALKTAMTPIEPTAKETEITQKEAEEKAAAVLKEQKEMAKQQKKLEDEQKQF
ncbi:hypothetical protein SAMN04487935_3101 [Flavobacterium noncentrifugens]|uniref:Uncharacterized protein n=2 Tax=Flavobacterium noncentrifugens TaxID=1128970 RepID=A0A1G9AXX3_9FLAO|nr:hypothetical protein SAMN04487935_3101 [Flavobacterium noncentrifugens]